MGKPKVNKLARMSDEERARYLQHRADLEEEARRRKRELIAKFIKNKLDKEEAYSRMNISKINQAWRYVLRRIKCKQMAQDIQNMIGSFNFMMDRKSRLLAALIKALEDSDDQHRRAFQAHTETVSYFLGIGCQGLDKLQSEYEYQKNTLLENWDREEMDLTDCQDKAEFKLKLVTFIQRRDFRNHWSGKDLAITTTKNDMRLEFEEDMRDFHRPKQLEIEQYWSKLREVYSTYLELHTPMMSHYQSLREKDDFYQRDIARNDFQIQQATDNLTNLQKEWNKLTTNLSTKLARMASHKEVLSRKYWRMKKDIKQEKGQATEQLAVMVNASQDAITRLEKSKDKMDKVLQMADICKKYEHEGDASFLAELDVGNDTLDFEHLDRAMIEECKEYRKMDKFMLKMNRVKVQTLCLNAEKAKLAKENMELKQYIKRYLTDLALKNSRPISMRVPSVEKVEDGKVNRPVTCIEGALSNAVMHEKRMKTLYKKTKDNAIRAYPRVQCWT